MAGLATGGVWRGGEGLLVGVGAACLFATLGDQFVRPHFGWRSDAAEVFLRFAHGSHPGFEHDAPGAAFRDNHRRAWSHAEFFAERSGYQHSCRAIYFALVLGSCFARHIPISSPSDLTYYRNLPFVGQLAKLRPIVNRPDPEGTPRVGAG